MFISPVRRMVREIKRQVELAAIECVQELQGMRNEELLRVSEHSPSRVRKFFAQEILKERKKNELPTRTNSQPI